MKLKLDSTESIQGIYSGEEVDFDRYNFLEKTLSTKETSIVISYIEGDKEPITGDQVAYGSWYDLIDEDIQMYVEHLIDNGLLKRELPNSPYISKDLKERKKEGLLDKMNRIENNLGKTKEPSSKEAPDLER